MSAFSNLNDKSAIPAAALVKTLLCNYRKIFGILGDDLLGADHPDDQVSVAAKVDRSGEEDADTAEQGEDENVRRKSILKTKSSFDPSSSPEDRKDNPRIRFAEKL